MTRANINLIWQNIGESPRTLFHYHNGDQYPSGLRDYYNVLDFVKGDFTPENFKKWIRENYKQPARQVTEFKNGLTLDSYTEIDKPAEPEDLGQGGQPKIYYTDGFATDYTYVFTTVLGGKKIIVWNWADKIFEGNDKEFTKWIKSRKRFE